MQLQILAAKNLKLQIILQLGQRFTIAAVEEKWVSVVGLLVSSKQFTQAD